MSQYIHGHHSSVIASHGARTAADSAAYLLPHLRPGMHVLDIGCGPGTITLDLAEAVAGERLPRGPEPAGAGPESARTGSLGPRARGRVVGLENTPAPLETARANAATRGDTSTEWVIGDAYELPYGDDTFDVTHAHQVLQHLTDPVAALREMARVTKPGGLVAARDADYGGMIWHPELPGLTKWLDAYRRTARAAGGDPDAARHMLAWANAAGLGAEVQVTTSTWSYAGPEGRAFWGGQWVERATKSAFASQSVEHGIAGQADLEEIADAWRTWSQHPDAWFAMLHTELLARV